MSNLADELNSEITDLISGVIRAYDPDINLMTLASVVIDICHALNEADFAIVKQAVNERDHFRV